MTFFTTLPPALNASPRPLIAWKPSRWSRGAPALIRRGPERLQETTPPIVCRRSGVPSSARQSTGSKASICWRAASSASISSSGVPAAAVSTSSAGS